MFGTNSEDLLLGVDSDRFNQRDGSVFESKPFAYQSEEEYEEDQSKIANVMEKIDRNPQAFERFRKMGAVNINVNEVRVNGLKRSKREWVESVGTLLRTLSRYSNIYFRKLAMLNRRSPSKSSKWSLPQLTRISRLQLPLRTWLSPWNNVMMNLTQVCSTFEFLHV